MHIAGDEYVFAIRSEHAYRIDMASFCVHYDRILKMEPFAVEVYVVGYVWSRDFNEVSS